MEQTQQWYKSWTLWFNVVTIALGTVELINNIYPIPTQTLFIINSVGNLILRVFSTSKPVAFGAVTLNRK